MYTREGRNSLRPDTAREVPAPPRRVASKCPPFGRVALVTTERTADATSASLPRDRRPGGQRPRAALGAWRPNGLIHAGSDVGRGARPARPPGPTFGLVANHHAHRAGRRGRRPLPTFSLGAALPRGRGVVPRATGRELEQRRRQLPRRPAQRQRARHSQQRHRVPARPAGLPAALSSGPQARRQSLSAFGFRPPDAWRPNGRAGARPSRVGASAAVAADCRQTE